MNDIERHSVKDEAKANRITGSTIFMWVLGVGIILMIVAYLSGYLTMGGPEGQQRMGAVSADDTSIVTKSDTIIGN